MHALLEKLLHFRPIILSYFYILFIISDDDDDSSCSFSRGFSWDASFY